MSVTMSEMLGTIRMPYNMNMIAKNLPQANYETDKAKKHEKEKARL